jgi:hypothetical protein
MAETLAQFILARIADDETNPVGVGAFGYATDTSGEMLMPPRKNISARWLAECAAKRAIVEWVLQMYAENSSDEDHLLRALAAPFADHPDYDPTWTIGPSAQENG